MAVQFDNNNLYAKAKPGRILIDNKKESRELKMLEDMAEKGLDMGQTYLGEFYEKKNKITKKPLNFIRWQNEYKYETEEKFEKFR
ncbi:hypothetical protein GLOIN_2v1481253 [Rhizophagus clarus]|uniref:Uncharacterized protein n=1 Tax=Rhizophagus clarus TaxID=94130 RepID=A0A8H3R8Z7_9GLOM|nr:hypothetical protein GLOIN_2v1481253 [Rhizophagus clarus]